MEENDILEEEEQIETTEAETPTTEEDASAAEDASTTEETSEIEQHVEDSFDQLKRFTEEDEDLVSATKTLRSILGGDFLTANFVRRQLLLILLIFGCFFCHISLRYINQKELVEIDQKKKQLDDARFQALTRFSELTAKSRQTYIEEFLKEHNDSTLQTSTNPPYIIHLNGEEGNFPAPTQDASADTTKKVVEEHIEDGTVE